MLYVLVIARCDMGSYVIAAEEEVVLRLRARHVMERLFKC